MASKYFCSLDSDCEFMYTCQDKLCIHDEIFPVNIYTICIYAFTALACGICNISGNSMGIFKMLILMTLLNYEIDEATGLAQALVVGTALPNFMSILFQKHPNGQGSLVNYNLIYIIIPCCLLGSTIGALSQNFIPKIGQTFLLVLLFSFFIYKFFHKIKAYKLPNSTINNQSLLQKTVESQQVANTFKNDDHSFDTPERTKALDYEKSMHFKDILASIGVFLIFELIVFLVQGKLPFYSVEKCTLMYVFGIVGITAVTLVYLFLMKCFIQKRFQLYDKHQIVQEIRLDQAKNFFLIASGGFTAGLVQGVLGMGCGTFIMMVLLSFPITSTMAVATSGYQILFTGLGSLVEYFINGEVKMLQSIWFIGICSVVGGVVTMVMYSAANRLSPPTLNKSLYAIIISLSFMSIVMTALNVINMVNRQGWNSMLSIEFSCNT